MRFSNAIPIIWLLHWVSGRVRGRGWQHGKISVHQNIGGFYSIITDVLDRPAASRWGRNEGAGLWVGADDSAMRRADVETFQSVPVFYQVATLDALIRHGGTQQVCSGSQYRNHTWKSMAELDLYIMSEEKDREKRSETGRWQSWHSVCIAPRHCEFNFSAG